MMGIAAYLVWESKKPKRLIPFAKAAFCGQLSFNLLWSISFFGFRSLGKGLIDIVALLDNPGNNDSTVLSGLKEGGMAASPLHHLGDHSGSA